MGWSTRWRRRVRALVRRDAVERELDEELAFHLELETEKYVRDGMSPADARRRAAIAFGARERHREEVRDARWLAWSSGLSPDVKLAFRMLAKNPALTVIGTLGMAVAIAIATGFFTFMQSFYYSTPPLPGGDRIVALENVNVQDGEDWSAASFDYRVWREGLTSVRDVAAYRLVPRDVSVDRGMARRARIAEMTASGFAAAGIAPLLGRPLSDSDEFDGAPPVAVIGYDEWREDFGGGPDVLGRQIRIGDVVHTIVGVMPEGFRFPIDNGIWTALATAGPGPGEGPRIYVFGRLAPGVDRDGARAELSAIGARLASEYPETHERLRPAVLSFIHPILDVQQYPAWFVWLLQLVAALLLAVVAVNVAVLVYARTATRIPEIAMRTALGAKRRRIVAQLFVEALVLSGLAAALGLLIAAIGYREFRVLLANAPIPYWIPDNLAPATAAYALALAVLAAFVVGVLPAIQATGRNVRATIGQLGGATGLRMGRTWTALIVVQVAMAVAVLPVVVAVAWDSVSGEVPPVPAYPTDEFLALRLAPDDGTTPASDPAGTGTGAVRTVEAELIRRLDELPEVARVTYATGAPPVGPREVFEIEDAPSAAVPADARVQVATVAPDYFETFEIPLVAGRSFDPSDPAGASAAVIVNRAFVHDVLGGGDALGRRVRPLGDPAADAGPAGPWYEIVGVVADMHVDPFRTDLGLPAVYHPAPLEATGVSIAVRMRGSPREDVARRIRELAADVAPGMALTVAPMSDVYGANRGAIRFVVLIAALIVLSVLLLSAAGIYALMSVAVTRRLREIGIRVALGAPRGRIVRAIFSRATRQLAFGLTAGIAVAGLLDRLAGGALLAGRAPLVLLFVATLMVAAGALAAMGPARRGLRVQPMETLRQE